MDNLKIVAIGGGTGLSILLSGLKKVSYDLVAVVAMADDGGGSGVLREDLGMLPPGDIRACIIALANTEPVIEQLMQYRFTEGRLKGQSFGNLFIAAMNGISQNFEEAIRKMNDVLAVTGKVLPVTLTDLRLAAHLSDGSVVEGESKIPSAVKCRKARIERLEVIPADAPVLTEVLEEIAAADVVLVGPGSLYTSVLSNLLLPELVTALERTHAKKVFITNVMTQPGETDGFGAWDHMKVVVDHIGSNPFDHVIVNNRSLPEDVLALYAEENSYPVRFTESDDAAFKKNGVCPLVGPYAEVVKHYIRHDAEAIARRVVDLPATKLYKK